MIDRRGDRASIEAEIDAELARTWDGNLDALARRVADRLQIDVEVALSILRQRVAGGEQAPTRNDIAPGKVPAHLLRASRLANPYPRRGRGARRRPTDLLADQHRLWRRSRESGKRPPGDLNNARVLDDPANPSGHRPDSALHPDNLNAAFNAALGFFPPREARDEAATREELPYRAEMEEMFGEHLGGIAVRTGAAGELGPHNVVAAATADEIVFADESPSAQTVAHEVTHVLQHQRGTLHTGAKEESAPSDASEKEAARAADHFPWRTGGMPFQIREAPTAAVHFQREGEEHEESDEPPPLASESTILSVLRRTVSKTDARGLQARKRRLMELFRAIQQKDRTVLRQRLAESKKADALARAFRSRLAKPTRDALRRVLDGEAVPLPEPMDPILGSAFVGPQNEIAIAPTPAAITIDKAWNPRQKLTLQPTAAFCPPIGEFLTYRVVVTRKDEDGAPQTVGESTADWPVGKTEPRPAAVVITEPGEHHAKLELIQNGFVVRSESLSFEVEGQEQAGIAERVAGNTDLAGAVHSMTDEELVNQARAIAERLAVEVPRGSTPGFEPSLSDDYQRLSRAQSVLRFEANERGISDQLGVVRDTPPEMTSVSVPGLDLELAADDPAVLRQQLEALFAERGHDGTVEYLQPLLAYEPWVVMDEQDATALKVKAAVIRQLGFLHLEQEQFIESFAATAKNVGLGLLAQSRTHVRAAMAQYGIKEEEATMSLPGGFGSKGGQRIKTGKLHADTSNTNESELSEMLNFARHLVALHKEIERSLNQRYVEADSPRTKDWGTVRPEDRDGGRFAKLMEEFTTLRQQALEKHPALEDFMNGSKEPNDAMESLAGKSPDSAAKTVGGELVGHLMSIEEAKTGIESGELSIWKNPKIVEVTKAHMGVVPGSMRDGLVRGKAKDEMEGDWTDTLITVVTLGAAILAAFLPGGQALAAELALVAVDLALISQEVDAYRLQKAATNTDFAEARKLAEGEPSMFPIVVSMIAMGVGLGGVKSAVTKVTKLRSTVRAAGSADAAEVRALQKELNELGAAHGKADLGDEVVRSATRAGDDIARLARMSESGVKGTVAEQGTEALSRRLGVDVQVDQGLGNGARINYVVDDATGNVVIKGLRVGPDAVAGVVLAHRRVIARMTRYNGVVGSLRGMWDRLRDGVTRRMKGTVRGNPFPVGSRGWESWEELAKIDELIAMRRARWQGELDAKTLDDDIAYLEAERDFHRSVVDAIEADELAYKKGVGFVEAPKTGAITVEAEAAGYHLPPDHGEHYYYKRVYAADKKTVIRYQLAIKPSAPDELNLPSLQPKMVDGKPVKGSFERSGRQRVKEHIGPAETVDDVVEKYLGDSSTSSLKPYAAMLEAQGIAKKGEVEKVIGKLRRGKFAGVADVDKLRHAVKEHFHKKTLKHLSDDGLDEAASYARMREMTLGLNNKDKANLTETWYQGRHAPDSVAEVPVPNAKKERKIDLVEGDTAIEVKSGSGALSKTDKEQLESYLKMVREETEIPVGEGTRRLKRLRYVFTDPKGAKSNLEHIEKVLALPRKKASVTVFGPDGAKTTITKMSDIPAWMRT